MQRISPTPNNVNELVKSAVQNSIIFQTDCQGLQEISLIMDVYRLALKVKSFLQWLYQLYLALVVLKRSEHT